MLAAYDPRASKSKVKSELRLSKINGHENHKTCRQAALVTEPVTPKSLSNPFGSLGKCLCTSEVQAFLVVDLGGLSGRFTSRALRV